MAYIVKTVFNGEVVDEQTVSEYSELKDNDYVVFDKEAELQQTAGDNLSGGSTQTPTGESHQKAREIFESRNINVLTVDTVDKEILDAYASWIKQVRNEFGLKFQIAVPYLEGQDYNDEGIIVFYNQAKDSSLTEDQNKTALMYWFGGVESGCPVQSSCQNTEYNGRLTPNADLSRAQIRKLLDMGVTFLHTADGVPVLYNDVNSLVKISDKDKEKKNEDFKQNQTIRTLDYITLGIARIFNKDFLGRVPNDDAGRVDLKTRILKFMQECNTIRAIQNYDGSYLYIEAGERLPDVIGGDAIQVNGAMQRLFFTINLVA